MSASAAPLVLYCSREYEIGFSHCHEFYIFLSVVICFGFHDDALIINFSMIMLLQSFFLSFLLASHLSFSI